MSNEPPAQKQEASCNSAAPAPTVREEMRHKPVEVPREELSAEDQERFKLLYGPYYPPRTHRGAFLACEWRGTIKVGGYSDAPIPWPYAFRTGYRSLILCGDLVRAVKLESELAIAYHWKVSTTTVGKWRQVLGVEMWNAGSRRLLWHAVDLARTSEAREKISQAARGRVLSPAHRERLRESNRRPKSEAFKKLMSDKMRERLAGGQGLSGWTDEEEALLGTMPDRELAHRLGRSVGGVAARRFLKQAGRLADPSSFSWSVEQDELLKTASPKEAARLLNRPLKVIQARRRALGLRAIRPSARSWNPEADEVVRTDSIAQAAQLLGRTTTAIENRRRKLGLTRPHPASKPWTPAELRLLGTKQDRVLAREFNRRTGAVQQKRKSLGIALCPEKHRWLPADDSLLERYRDEDVARLLKVTVQSVKMRRIKLGIPIKHSKVRPWTMEEDRLLGTAPDEEIARKLGRSLLSVRMKRAKTGQPYAASKIKYWTASEDQMLGTRPDEEVAALLGRSVWSVKLRRFRLKSRAGTERRPASKSGSPS